MLAQIIRTNTSFFPHQLFSYSFKLAFRTIVWNLVRLNQALACCTACGPYWIQRLGWVGPKVSWGFQVFYTGEFELPPQVKQGNKYLCQRSPQIPVTFSFHWTLHLARILHTKPWLCAYWVLALIEHHLIYLLWLGYDLPVLLDPGLQFQPQQKRELSENDWNFIHQKLSISVYTSHLHAFSDTWTNFRFYFS